MVDVAQSVRASDCGSEGRRFEPDLPPLNHRRCLKRMLLKEPDKYGLLMLERSARQGGHAVFEREKGKTVLENQVRIAIQQSDLPAQSNSHQ